MTMRSLLTSFVFCSTAILFCGCGEKQPTYPVQGKVQFANGKPLPGGSVEFLTKNAEGKPVNARGPIEADGTFQLKTRDKDGAIAGKHQIIVMPVRVDAVTKDTVIPPNPVDTKFSSYATSGLSFTVQPQEQNECVLTVKPPATSQ